MALTPEQIAALQYACEQMAEPINAWLLRDAAQRIAAAGKMTSTAAYRLYRAAALGASKRELQAFLKKQLNISCREIRRLFRQAVKWSAGNAIDRLDFGQYNFVSAEIEQATQAAIWTAGEEFTNLTKTLGMVAPNGKALPLQDFYQKTMDFAFQQVFTGATDHESAIRQATAKMANCGVRVIDYKSGVHTSVEVAVRRNIMGGLGLLCEQVTQKEHDLLGCNGWEISAHMNSAPDHEPYQGRQFSDAEYEKLNGSLARRIGTLNCGHVAMPIILGVNSPMYTPGELEELKRKNAEGFEYQGRHYTGYKATQKQRQIERTIRKQKNRILTAEATEDKRGLQSAQIRYHALEREYQEFSKAAGLRTQYQRAEVIGFGPNQANAASASYKNVAKQANTMYNTGSEKGNIRAWQRDKPIRDKINSGELPLNIRHGQQNKHIPGTHEYSQYAEKLKNENQFGPSRLTIGKENISKLVEEYHGTGIIIRDKNGNWRNLERITVHPDKVGVSVNNLTGTEADTTTFTIHYSKDGVHIVPDYPSRKGEKGT